MLAASLPNLVVANLKSKVISNIANSFFITASTAEFTSIAATFCTAFSATSIGTWYTSNAMRKNRSVFLRRVKYMSHRRIINDRIIPDEPSSAS